MLVHSPAAGIARPGPTEAGAAWKTLGGNR
jgi:hypothetical protein